MLKRLVLFLKAAIEKYSFAQLQQITHILDKYMG